METIKDKIKRVEKLLKSMEGAIDYDGDASQLLHELKGELI